MEYNVYCDESCHLENDHLPVMLVGCIWCPKHLTRKISKEIRDIKLLHNALGETKWVKVSDSRRGFYKALVDYFFSNNNLHFRCLVVKNKERLDHEYFNKGDHDTFYYKMYYSLLNKVLSPENAYSIYLDTKDTRSKLKVKKLGEILCNNVYDFTREMISNIDQIKSHESELLQLADLLIGAVGYTNRHLETNPTKIEVARYIEEKIARPLTKTTSLFEDKFNLFIFSPSESPK